jgi:DNA invertase Pin-like site-specific DNA recombinase
MPQKVRRKAGYRRISDEDGQSKGTSLSDQLDAIRAAVIKNGGTLKEEHIFTDTLSGNGKYWRERDGIQDMLAAAKRHEFDDLYITCLDRFGRDVIIQEFLIQELKHYDVTVLSLKADEPTDRNDTVSQMARWFWGMMAQEELKKIKERTQRGIRGRVVKKHALLPGSRPLYGYHWQDKEMLWEGEMIIVPKAIYIVYEEEARIVRAIFQWCRLRMPVARIAKMLTEMGVPSPNGKALWRATTVHNILSNESYTGIHYAFKRKFEHVPGEGIHREFRSKNEWLTVDSQCIPLLVDPATFEEVQKILEKNKLEAPRNNANPEDTLCRSGRCVCGYCGSNLSVQRDKVRGYISYRCYRENQGYNECKGSYVRSRIVDAIAWNKAVEVILNPCLVEQELERQRIEDPTKGSLKAAEELLMQTVSSIINLTQSLEVTTNPLTRDILTKRLDELATLKVGYEDQYDQILRFRINWEDAMRSLDEFKKWCDSVRPELTNPDFQPTYKQMRDALEMIGIRVIVFRENHNPRFIVEVSPPDIMSKFRVVVKGKKDRIESKSS